MALFGSPRAFLGLDIDSTGIQLVEIIDRRHPELATYAFASRPKGTSALAVADRVAQMLSKAQASADVVVMSLRSQDIFSTMVTLPDIPADQFAKAIRFKAQDIIPARLADVTLTWTRQRRRRNRPIQVYLTATPKRTIAWHRQLALQLNLKLQALEPEIFPLIRTHDVLLHGNALLCNIGREFTSFHGIAAGSIIASRTLEWGTNQFSEANDGSLEPLVQEAQQMVNSHNIKKTILVGRGALVPKVAKALHNVLGHEPRISNPWHGLTYPRELESALTELGPALAVAVGLAQRRVPPRIE